jgi:hypothetical protein
MLTVLQGLRRKKKILLILRNKIHIISSGTGATVKKEKK